MEHHGKDPHPGQPQQPENGFGEGLEHEPRTPEEEREPDFARGQRHTEDEEELEHTGRFSEGVEEIPEELDPEKTAEGRFSEGQDHIREGD